jgi:hypothetical protein
VKKNLAIIALLVFLVVLLVRHLQTEMRLYSAQGKVETISKLQKAALNSTNASVVIENLDYILWYCSTGLKDKAESALDVLVENYQKSATSEMVGHLKQITGRNLGDNPKVWIDAYKGATNAPAKAP